MKTPGESFGICKYVCFTVHWGKLTTGKHKQMHLLETVSCLHYALLLSFKYLNICIPVAGEKHLPLLYSFLIMEIVFGINTNNNNDNNFIY